MTGPIRSALRRALAIGALVAACGIGAAANAASPAQEIASAKLAIDAANDDWLPAVRAKDAKRVVAPYADDGMFIVDNEVVRGRAAIERMMAGSFDAYGKILSATIKSDGMQYAGGAVIEWGHGDVRREGKDGRVTSSTSHYVTIWKRDAQGVWRIQRNILL